MQKQMINSNQLDFREPTLQQVADLCSEFGFACAGEADLACLRALLREGSSRWGRPAPVLDGEVGELVAYLKLLREEIWSLGDIEGVGARAWGLDNLTRAAALLEQQQGRIAELEAELEARQLLLKPVPVSDPPGAKDCDAKGRCWFFDPCDHGWWWLRPALIIDNDPEPLTHWLPVHALPIPQKEVE